MTKFCVHSQTGISIVDAAGYIRPCCKFKDTSSLPKIDQVDTLNNIHQQEPFKSIRRSLNKGIFPAGCRECARQETAGIQSRRQETNKMYGKHNLFMPTYIQDMEFALDYTCNMMCRMCNPGASSKWGAAHSVIEKFKQHDIDLDTETGYKDYQDRIKEVLEKTDLSHARHIKIEGGEPFYAKHFEWFIDKLDREVVDKSKLFLNITTNGSVYPDERIIKKLQSFNTTIAFSIDAHGALAECLRWGVSWNTIEENIKRFKTETHFNLFTNITVSILNFNAMYPLVRFCDSIGLRTSFNELTHPEYLSIYQLPLSVREQYKIGIEQFDTLLLADTTVEPEFDKLLKSIDILDQYHNTDFAQINGEVLGVINANIGK